MMRLGQFIPVLFYRNPPAKIIALPLARCARADRATARRGSLILARGFFRPPLHPLGSRALPVENPATLARGGRAFSPWGAGRSEEHTSELQSLRHLGCRLLL